MKNEKNDKLHEAVMFINEAIAAEYKRLEEITKTEEADPILIESETLLRLIFKITQTLSFDWGFIFFVLNYQYRKCLILTNREKCAIMSSYSVGK